MGETKRSLLFLYFIVYNFMFFLLIICLLFAQFSMVENIHLLYLSESLKLVLHRSSDCNFILVTFVVIKSKLLLAFRDLQYKYLTQCKTRQEQMFQDTT